jgi:hypothetical protein
MDEAGVSHGAKQREAAPQSAKAFCGLCRAQLVLLPSLADSLHLGADL